MKMAHISIVYLDFGATLYIKIINKKHLTKKNSNINKKKESLDYKNCKEFMIFTYWL